MADGGITVVDGTQLRSLNISLPDSAVSLTGAHVLDLAESSVSDSLFGLSLPPTLRSSALKRAAISDDVNFRLTDLSRDAASTALKDYLAAIADELNDNPMVVSILDGKMLRLFLEDEDDFAMIAENLFTELDTEDKGKIRKSEIRNALANMGIDMGIPPFEEFPVLNAILKKHGVEGEEELGVSQFAELLHPILQEVADSLAKKHVTVVHNVQIINGSKLRKLLADEKKLNDVIENITKEKCNGEDDQRGTEIIRSFLGEKGQELGLPPSESNEAVLLLYDAVFNDIENGKCDAKSEDDLGGLLREILEKFAEQLDANPVFHDIES